MSLIFILCYLNILSLYLYMFSYLHCSSQVGKRRESLICCKDCVLPSKLEIEECQYNEEIASAHSLFTSLIMTTIHLIVLGVQVNYDTCNMILSFSMRNMSRMVNYVDINHDIELSYGIHLRYGFSKKNDPFSGIFVNINDQCSF